MLDASRINKEVPGRFFVQAHDCVSSTNTLIKDALRQNCGEGLVITSLTQDGGYGRQGRAWTSPFGGLYFSLALRPQVSFEELPTLSLVVALALKSAFESLEFPNIQIKWPNDILLNEAKLVGISLESVAGGVCIGIGINVFPEDATSLSENYNTAYLFAAGEHGDVVVSKERQKILEDTLIASLKELDRFYEKWLLEGFVDLQERYQEALYNKGSFVRLEAIDHSALYEGVVEGVNEFGQLILRQADGLRIAASSGEVHTVH